MQLQKWFGMLHQFLMPVSQWAVIGLTVGLIAASLGAVFGLWPWLSFVASVNGAAPQDIGHYVQIGAAVFGLILLIYLPANARMAALERSHRSFNIGMDDVTRAYVAAHAADRASVFTLSGEFENMRSKMEHMRAHPDLRNLEPELLQLAAQMSLQTREIALTYAQDKVDRAKQFLQARQQDIDLMSDRITQAHKICEELRLWAADIDVEDRAIKKQMKALDEKLRIVLPKLGYDFDFDDPRLSAQVDNVISLTKAAN